MSADGYSAGDAAKVLGRSERLVRKLAAEGRLDVVQQTPLRVSQESVHRERNLRRDTRRTGKPKPEPGVVLDAEQLRQIVDAAVDSALKRTLPLVLESRDAVEQRMAEELAAARQQIERLQRDLDDAQRRKWRKRKDKKKR